MFIQYLLETPSSTSGTNRVDYKSHNQTCKQNAIETSKEHNSTSSQLKSAVELSGAIGNVIDESVLYCNEYIQAWEENTCGIRKHSNACATGYANLDSGSQKRRSLDCCDHTSSETTVCEKRYCEEDFPLRPTIDRVESLDNTTPLFVYPRDLHPVPEQKFHRAFSIPSGWAETFL